MSDRGRCCCYRRLSRPLTNLVTTLCTDDGSVLANGEQRDEADLASLQMDDFAHSVSPTSARLIKKTADGRVGDRPDGLQRNFDAPDDDGVRKTRT